MKEMLHTQPWIARSQAGDDALELAIRRKHEETAKLLADVGASVSPRFCFLAMEKAVEELRYGNLRLLLAMSRDTGAEAGFFDEPTVAAALRVREDLLTRESTLEWSHIPEACKELNADISDLVSMSEIEIKEAGEDIVERVITALDALKRIQLAVAEFWRQEGMHVA